jgi:hypothetical protein
LNIEKGGDENMLQKTKKEKSRSLTERLQDGLSLFCTTMLAAGDLLKLIEALIKAIH